MAEFSVITKKKEEEKSSRKEQPKYVFYGSSDEDNTLYLSSGRNAKKTKKKKKITKKSQKKSTKKEEDLVICPVCHEVLDERIKRVYTKPIVTEVYFPFLDREDNILPSFGHIPKVKICYPCYEHLMLQWKEYNRAGIPHRKRKYRDRNGNRIKTAREISREEQRKATIAAEEASALSESEEEEEDQEHKKQQHQEEKEENEQKEQEKAATAEEQRARDEVAMEALIEQIHAHIEHVDYNANANLERVKKEIEHTIRKHSNRMKDDIQSLKVENEVVRKQVVRMRRELGEMRLEVGKDVHEVKKQVQKQENRYKRDKESDNENNIQKNQTSHSKPFYP